MKVQGRSINRKYSAAVASICTSVFACFSGVAQASSERASPPTAQQLLSIAKPAPLPESPWSATRILALAFYDADLGALLRDSGSADCFVQDARIAFRNGDVAGRVSARACISSREQNYYERFATVAAIRPTTEVGLPNYKPNSVDMSMVSKDALNRFATRVATNSIKRNEFLKTLIEGKVDIKFSLRDIGSLPSKFAVPQENRPEYKLAVSYREPKTTMIKVASLGGDAKFLKNSSASSLHDMPIVERQIVEVWPTPAPVSVAPAADIPGTDDRFTKKVQRTLGLAMEPFAQFRLRLERGGLGTAGTALSLRFEDSSGIGAVDLTGLMQGRPDGIAWEMRVPYKQHAALITRDNLTMMNRYVYEYSASSALRTRFAYDPNTAVGVVPDAAHGKYSVGLSYSF